MLHSLYQYKTDEKRKNKNKKIKKGIKLTLIVWNLNGPTVSVFLQAGDYSRMGMLRVIWATVTKGLHK